MKSTCPRPGQRENKWMLKSCKPPGSHSGELKIAKEIHDGKFQSRRRERRLAQHSVESSH